MHHVFRVLLGVAALGALATSATAQATKAATDNMHFVDGKSLTWTEPTIPGFDPGMKLAVVHGNPDVDGAYTIRLSFPDGYKFPAHFHPKDENLTVLSGTFLLGMGDTRDDTKIKSYSAGDFLNIPGSMPHFGGARGATVIQLHGQGPFAISLATPRSK